MSEGSTRLGRLLRPRHIAFIGGTQAAGPIAATRRAGFAGEIWAVNPARSDLAGVTTVPSVADLPEPPDAALVALGPDLAIDVVAQLAERAAGGAVVISGGFAEVGDAGRVRQERLVGVAGVMPVIGPNCMGVINQFDGAAVWATDNHLEQVSAPAAAIISQSGAMLYGITNVEQGFPLGYAISTGNQATVDAAMCIEAVLDDHRVRAIGLYLEGVSHGNRLADACLRAVEMGVPVVGLKGADTVMSQDIAVGHTASMVVDADLWQAFADRYGIVPVETPKALVEALKLLAVSGVPAGRRLAAVTYSGGVNGLIATHAERGAFDLPAPNRQAQEAMRNRLPEEVPVRNPLDLNIPYRSTSGIDMEDRDAIVDTILDLAEDTADLITFFVDVPRPSSEGLGSEWSVGPLAMIEAAARLGLPAAVASVLPEGLDVDLRRRLVAGGVAPLLGFRDAIDAIASSVSAGEIVRKATQGGRPPRLIEVEPEPAPSVVLDEAESKAQLRRSGILIPDGWAGSPAEAAAAAERIGFPVAVKVLDPIIPHKWAAGGVRLWLGSRSEVERAITDLERGLPRVSAVLVERMIVDAALELILGVKRSAAMGLAIMIGLGGVHAEEIGRHQTALLPIDRNEVDLLVGRLPVALTPTQRAGVVSAAGAVGRLAVTMGDGLVGLDINPLIVTATGECVAADGLLTIRSQRR